MNISPLMTIPGALSQAIATDQACRETASSLLAYTFQLDALLDQAISARPIDEGMIYVFDPLRWNHFKAQTLFTNIRDQNKTIESNQPLLHLLHHVADLVDYTAHITTNILSVMTMNSREVGKSYSDDRRPRVEYAAHELSFSTYMGISPQPAFGTTIDYQDELVANYFTQFGFGAFVYLSIASDLSLVRDDRLPPNIAYNGKNRPITAQKITRQDDETVVLWTEELGKPETLIGKLVKRMQRTKSDKDKSD